MEVRRSHVSAAIRTEGGLLPADLLARIASGEPKVPGLAEADYGLETGVRFGEAITRSWNRLVGAWAVLAEAREVAPADERLTSVTRDRFLLPLFEELGFGRLPAARAVDIEGTAYPVSHAHLSLPVHLVAIDVPLDRRTPGVRGAAGAAPHALVQELLNRSDERLWGFVSNGRTLRLLRDNSSLTRQAYLEFDLEAIFTGQAYADFSLLWLVSHRSRFSGGRTEDWVIERWTKLAAEEGTRALESLRGGVTNAIETLGVGFLAAPANAALRDGLRAGELDRQDFYRELLRLVYRLIFLFTAEDRHDEATGRELLLDPDASDEAVERYRCYYSTARLRASAARRRGTRHGDLWAMLRRVIGALGSDAGAPSIALPALGSFLFGPDACPDLDAAELRNEDLLAAVRQLATIEEDRRLRTVDYANLGAEELGSVYESLLELHPRLEMEANPPVFSLSTAAGNERKTTGSYYTPTSLINCLLDSALDPVLDEAARSADPERAILELSVVDPAAGSGHFLVAAAHRIAKRLAAARTGEGEPPPSAVRHALRDVISHCIYAVDLNPMAVELCKVSLWLEALEPGKPLTFLDAHIKTGNSLLGTTPDLVEQGIPDAAFEAITGDDKTVARAWRDRNRKEREGQQTLFDAGFELPVGELAQGAAGIDALTDDDPISLRAKEERNRRYLGSDAYRRAKLAADAWCAAFVVPKVAGAPEVTTGLLRALGSGRSVAPGVETLVADTARDYAFFHWPLEFPQVFAEGGFDVVVGNPPWDQLQFDDLEFFSFTAPEISNAATMSLRRRMIEGLAESDPDLYEEYLASLRRVHAVQGFVHDSGRFPLTSFGRLNLAPLFAELGGTITGPRGMCGFVLPTGIATDSFNQYFFSALVRQFRLVSLHSFENEEFIFPSVHHAFKFCLMTTAGLDRTVSAADFVFFARNVSSLEERDHHFSLSSDDFELLNPNTRTCPTFRSAGDAALAKAIHRRVPILVRETAPKSDPWVFRGMLMFMMNTDSSLFEESQGPSLLPLYEAKMVHQFDHRFGTYQGQSEAQANQGSLPQVSDEWKRNPAYSVLPRWWVPVWEVNAKLAAVGDPTWLLVWRDITNSVAVRTVIATALPRVAVGNPLPIATSPRVEVGLLMANLNAFVLDWLARQKLGGNHLNFFLAKQLPILAPAAYHEPLPWADLAVGDWLRRRVVELTYVTHDLRPFAEELGWTGPPFQWSEDRRRRIRAEVDALYFHLYGLQRDEVEHVLDSFWIVRERDEATWGSYLTKGLILEAYVAMADAMRGRTYAGSVDPPPGHPSVANQASSQHPDGSWTPWEEIGAHRIGEALA